MIFAGKIFEVIFICGNLFTRIAGKTAKIRTRKKFVPHGISRILLFEANFVLKSLPSALTHTRNAPVN